MSATAHVDPTGPNQNPSHPPLWSLAASIRASGTRGTIDIRTHSSTNDVLLQIHESDDAGAHLVEAAIRLDRKAVRALALLLVREAAH